MILKSIRYSSFYIGKELVSEFNCLYFEIDNNWIKIVVSEGIITTKLVQEPLLNPISEIEDEYKYPVLELRDLEFHERFYSLPILTVHKIVLSDRKEVPIGLKILLSNDNHIIVYDNHQMETMNLFFNENKITEDTREEQIGLNLFKEDTKIGNW